MNRLIEIRPHQVPIVWPAAEKYLAQAMEGYELERDLVNLKARVMAGLDTLWRVDDEYGKPAAWATTLLYTSDGILATAQIKIAGAKDMQLFLGRMEEFENWAHSKGAHFIEVVGRKGWEKVLKPLGFTHNYTSLVKRVYKELH